MFDSDVSVFGCVADVLRIAAGAAATYTYPLFVARTALVVQIDSGKEWGAAIDYALGYPRVVFGALSFARTAVVFVF